MNRIIPILLCFFFLSIQQVHLAGFCCNPCTADRKQNFNPDRKVNSLIREEKLDSNQNLFFDEEKIVRGELARFLDLYLKGAEPFGFGGAVLIAKNDEVILKSGYGMSDKSTGTPNSPDTAFYIGSLAKQFTAAGILKLEEQGKLSVSGSIAEYLPNVPEDKRAITIHQLLTHTSGLPWDVREGKKDVSRDEHIRHVLAAKLDSTPGKVFGYSNAGYSLLAAIIEIVSEQSFEGYLNEQIFKPAGMNQTGSVLPKWSANEIAHGYKLGIEQGTPLDKKDWTVDGPSWEYRGAGGILSTVEDLFVWHQVLSGNSILSDQSRSKLFTPYIREGSSFYGYGWNVDKTARGTSLLWHDGSDGTYFANLRRYIDEKTVIILLTNQSYRDALVVDAKIQEILFSPNRPALPPNGIFRKDKSLLSRDEGVYESASGDRVNIKVVGDNLTIEALSEEALGMLTVDSGAQRIENRKLSRQANDVLNSFAKQDFEPLRAISFSNQVFDDSKSDLNFLRSFGEKQRGALQGFEVIGTATRWWGKKDNPSTFVLMKFESGNARLRLDWQNGKISWVEIQTTLNVQAAQTIIQPISPTAYIGFNLGIGKTVRLKVKRSREGKAVGIRIDTGKIKGKWARRVSEPVN